MFLFACASLKVNTTLQGKSRNEVNACMMLYAQMILLYYTQCHAYREVAYMLYISFLFFWSVNIHVEIVLCGKKISNNSFIVLTLIIQTFSTNIFEHAVFLG